MNMILCSYASACMKNIIRIRGCVQRQMFDHKSLMSHASDNSYCFFLSDGLPKLKNSSLPFLKTSSCSSFNGFQATQGSLFKKRCLNISLASQNIHVRLSIPKQKYMPKIKFHLGPLSWREGCASAGLIFGSVCYSNSEPVCAEAPEAKDEKESDCYSHGKKVYSDYRVIGIPGDGRCLFRSVAHGACLRSGKPIPNESQQRKLADELRAKVVDEFVKRRDETEWFIEGDFDTYISQMRKPHIWGGEPELLMASHVLQVPITVYMYDRDSCGMISIAEYGQEYGKENPVRVLYDGYSHYDALLIPGKKDSRSRL